MSIGLGIFFGLSFVAMTILFVKTKDSPRWSRFFKYLKFAVLAVVACAVIFVVYLYVKVKIDEMPKTQSTLGNVSLGDNLNDVGFRLGDIQILAKYNIEQINQQIANRLKQKEDVTSLLAEKRRYEKELTEVLNGKETVVYVDPKTSLLIVFNDGKVVDLQHICTVDSADMTSTNGIYCGATSERIIEKYGKELEILCRNKFDHDDDMYERRYVSNVNKTYYLLKKNSVVRVGVFQPTFIDTSLRVKTWKKCD